MRLFYITALLAIFISFATFASQKQNVNGSKKSAKLSFIYGKRQVKINSGSSQSDESLQKDFINNTTLKASQAACIPFYFLSFLFSEHKSINASTGIKRLKFGYWYLLKILYPKHVFW